MSCTVDNYISGATLTLQIIFPREGSLKRFTPSSGQNLFGGCYIRQTHHLAYPACTEHVPVYSRKSFLVLSLLRPSPLLRNVLLLNLSFYPSFSSYLPAAAAAVGSQFSAVMMHLSHLPRCLSTPTLSFSMPRRTMFSLAKLSTRHVRHSSRRPRKAMPCHVFCSITLSLSPNPLIPRKHFSRRPLHPISRHVFSVAYHPSYFLSGRKSHGCRTGISLSSSASRRFAAAVCQHRRLPQRGQAGRTTCGRWRRLTVLLVPVMVARVGVVVAEAAAAVQRR